MNPLPNAGGPRLVSLIAVRLIAVGVVFTFLNLALVVAMYAHDKQSLAEDLVALEARAITGALEEIDGKVQLRPFEHEAGSHAFVVFDHAGKRLFSENPDDLPLPTGVVQPEMETTTTYAESDHGFQAAGTSRVSVNGKDYWIAVVVVGEGLTPLLPGLVYELMEHVAIPLLPLSVLLVVFNLAVVKRMLGPLEAAVEDVNRLDLTQPGSQLRVPDSPAEVRALLNAINEAVGRMQQAVQLLQQFTADAAHELRTPLSVMTLRIDQLPVSEERRKLQEDAAITTRLVNQMLDLARADALEVPPDARTSLDSVASAVVTHLLPLALRSGRSISYAKLDPPEVVGQHELLERALRNLVQNALLYTPEGSTVDVTAGPGPIIYVRDHGPGIPTDIREQVLQRFWRTDRSRGQGAGLGLAIAQTIMAAHGGKVTFDDAPDGGAIVALAFPPLPAALATATPDTTSR